MSLYKPVKICGSSSLGISYDFDYWNHMNEIHRKLDRIDAKNFRRIEEMIGKYQNEIVQEWNLRGKSSPESAVQRTAIIDSYMVQFKETMANNIRSYS